MAIFVGLLAMTINFTGAVAVPTCADTADDYRLENVVQHADERVRCAAGSEQAIYTTAWEPVQVLRGDMLLGAMIERGRQFRGLATRTYE